MHYSVAVIVDGVSSMEKAFEQAEEMLDPYDESRYLVEDYDEDGESIYLNPEGFWDWYVLGGRFTGILQVSKQGPSTLSKTDLRDVELHGDNPVDICKIKDIDYEMIGHAKLSAAEACWKEMSEVECEKWSNDFSAYAKEKWMGPFSTFAILDGKGWDQRMWGDSNNDEALKEWAAIWRARVDAANPESFILIFDCHC